MLKLHPDHNRFGVELQKLVNEAYSVLSDITKRRRYDEELTSGAHTSRHNEPHHPDVTELEQKLAESKCKCTMLKKKLVSVQKEAGSAREQVLEVQEQKLAESKRQCSVLKKKNVKLQKEVEKLDESKQKHATLKKNIVSLQMEVGSVRHEAERLNKQLQLAQTKHQNKLKLHREKSKRLKEESRDQLLYFQDKIDKTGRELREERMRSANAKQRAINEAFILRRVCLVKLTLIRRRLGF